MKPPATLYAQTGNVNLAYQIVGQGPVDLIVIPGWISNVEETWNMPELSGWLHHLATFSRLILFDKRGTGLSDRVDEKELPDLSQRANDLRIVMEAAGCKKAALLGISEGVPMAAQFASAFPESVSGLIFYGGYSKWIKSGEYPWGLTRELHEKSITEFQKKWGQPIGFHLMAASKAHQPETQQQWATYLRRSASPATAVAFYRMNMEIDVRHILPGITTPGPDYAP